MIWEEREDGEESDGRRVMGGEGDGRKDRQTGEWVEEIQTVSYHGNLIYIAYPLIW